MICISCHEPWGSLIRVGQKRIETRSWRAPLYAICQRMAIHSAKRKMVLDEVPWWIWRPILDPSKLPYGTIHCTAILDACIPTLDVFLARPELCCNLERGLGDYSPGRWAWVLEDVRSLPSPIPTKGHQKLWWLDGNIVAAIQQQGGL